MVQEEEESIHEMSLNYETANETFTEANGENTYASISDAVSTDITFSINLQDLNDKLVKNK